MTGKANNSGCLARRLLWTACAGKSTWLFAAANSKWLRNLQRERSASQFAWADRLTVTLKSFALLLLKLLAIKPEAFSAICASWNSLIIISCNARHRIVFSGTFLQVELPEFHRLEIRCQSSDCFQNNATFFRAYRSHLDWSSSVSISKLLTFNKLSRVPRRLNKRSRFPKVPRTTQLSWGKQVRRRATYRNLPVS